MIWLDGELAAGDRLDFPRADRIFEHGLGLFETFRTWSGRAVLLDRHRARLRASARALGIDLAEVLLPGEGDVRRLVAAHGPGDRLVRLTVSAGRPPATRPAAWMTAAPLPAAPPAAGWRVVAAPWTVAVDDPLARHKTLNYWSRRLAHEQAQAAGADEAIFASADGRIWEGSRTNLFVVRGRDLTTPPRAGPITPGIMRGLVLEVADRAGFAAVEADVTTATLVGADEILLTNSVRGLIPVQGWDQMGWRPTDHSCPRTARLRRIIHAVLDPEDARP